MMEIESGFIWISPTEPVVSFHPVDGWEKKEYSDRASFRSLTESLLQKGYKFQ